MTKQIDLTGFITEDIEVKFGDDVYTIPIDIDVESYVDLLNYIQTKPGEKEFLANAKKFIIGIIDRNNEGVDKKKLSKHLGIGVISEFMVKYIDVLMDRGILKKAVTPQGAESKKKQ